MDDGRAAEFIDRFYAADGARHPAAAWRTLAASAEPTTQALAASWRVFGRP